MSQSPGRTLWVWDRLPKGMTADNQSWLREGDAVENVHRLHMGGHSNASFDRVISGQHPPQTVQHDFDSLGLMVKLAKPGASIKIVQACAPAHTVSNKTTIKTAAKLVTTLKLSGLVAVEKPVEVSMDETVGEEIRESLNLPPGAHFHVVEISCKTPNFAPGSSQKLKNTTKKMQVWSLDINDDDVAMVDQNDLLAEEDKLRPDEASLRVCGTTGKRKACKDCSCGLAEELADGIEPLKKSVNSSCGSCYLGDAFRCASCPYLGMPAFKPGEKIQLSERQLKADK